MMDGLNSAAKAYDMKINVKKTKIMVVSREEGRTANITVDGQKVEQVKTFKYLGAIITEKGTCVEEVKARIVMAKGALIRQTYDKRLEDRAEKENGEDSGMAGSALWV